MQTSGLNADVYIDVVLLINFIMDFFILWAAGKLARLKIRFVRLALGALFGAAYSLVVFLPEGSLLTSFVAKVCCSVIMVLLVYAPLSLARFVRSLCYMYLVTFVMGGAVIAAIYLTSAEPGYIQVWNGAVILLGTFNYSWLLIGLFIAALLGYGGVTLVRKNWLEKNFLYTLHICINGKKITLDAFLDTGNQLSDPLTKKPVIVVEAQALAGVIPQDLLKIVASEKGNELTSLNGKLEQGWSSRLRLIPFNSVGKEHGLMVGFRPDYVEIDSRKHIFCIDAVIGLVDRTLTTEGKYRALLPPQLLEGNVKEVKLCCFSKN